MANMEYCRFENTYKDLRDCYDALRNFGLEDYYDEASNSEKEYIHKLINLCRTISDRFADENDELQQEYNKTE